MRSSKKAFTLIELLVVIAIIALLVSILLPSLNRAKALAKKTVCISQMKGIGLCFMMYADANNDCLPMSRADYSGDQTSHHWFQLVSSFAGEQTSTVNDGSNYEYSELFSSCPEFTPPSGWQPGYGVVVSIQSFPDGTAPTSEYSNYQNWNEPGTMVGTVEKRFFKRSEFSDSTRRGWLGESPQWHIGGGPNTLYEPDNNLYPTWATMLGRDPERHVDSSNIWFIDGHAKDYKYDIGGNAFYDIEKLPF